MDTFNYVNITMGKWLVAIPSCTCAVVRAQTQVSGSAEPFPAFCILPACSLTGENKQPPLPAVLQLCSQPADASGWWIEKNKKKNRNGCACHHKEPPETEEQRVSLRLAARCRGAWLSLNIHTNYRTGTGFTLNTHTYANRHTDT